jgi:hypothetical protein
MEDIAYCLLGIFNINMPLLYSEKKNAFIRLQEEIMKHSDDQSLFAWGQPLQPLDYHLDAIASLVASGHYGSLLANSPVLFAHSSNIV